MPLVRIDLPRGKSLEYRRTIGDVVYEAMIQTINVPANDRFQVINEHAPESLIIDPTYLGVERGPDCMIIQIVLNEGRTTEMKKAFYRAVADGLHRATVHGADADGVRGAGLPPSSSDCPAWTKPSRE